MIGEDIRRAEDWIYNSYLEAQKYWDYSTPDALKRSPELSREILSNMSETPAVVITGSKGKGSVAAMTAQILQANKKVGLLTSPHIAEFRERFRVNGRMISEEEFIQHIEALHPLFDKIISSLPPGKCVSPMGIQAALALTFFKAHNTNFNVLECGKGARYDDVANVPHQFAVINSIFPEHTRELGNTVEKIAEDKAHVISGEQKYVFIGPQHPEAMIPIVNRAKRLNVPLKVYGKDFLAENIRFSQDGMVFDVVVREERYTDIFLPLLGEHQARNCALAIALCREISGPLDHHTVRESLSAIKWPGRLQIISKNPFVLLDACINAESTKSIKETLDYLKLRDMTLIVGIPDDKDFAGVVESMAPYASTVILTRSRNPHYKFTPLQQKKLNEMGFSTLFSSSIEEAMKNALSLGKPTIILGTTSLISDILSKS